VFDGGGHNENRDSKKLGSLSDSSLSGLQSIVNDMHTFNTKLELISQLTGKSQNENTIQLHYPSHNYAGPGTHTISNILEGKDPVDYVDSLAQMHDLAYLRAKTPSDLSNADSVMINSLLFKDKASPNQLILPTAEEYFTALALKLKGIVAPEYGLNSNVKLDESQYDFLVDYLYKKKP